MFPVLAQCYLSLHVSKLIERRHSKPSLEQHKLSICKQNRTNRCLILQNWWNKIKSIVLSIPFLVRYKSGSTLNQFQYSHDMASHRQCVEPAGKSISEKPSSQYNTMQRVALCNKAFPLIIVKIINETDMWLQRVDCSNIMQGRSKDQFYLCLNCSVQLCQTQCKTLHHIVNQSSDSLLGTTDKRTPCKYTEQAMCTFI